MSIPTKTHNLYVKDGKIWSRYFWSIIDLLYRAVNMRFLLISAVNLGILCKDCVKDASALRSKDDIQFHQHCNGKNSRLESSRWVITESTSNFITMTLNYKKCDSISYDYLHHLEQSLKARLSTQHSVFHMLLMAELGVTAMPYVTQIISRGRR